MKHCPINLVGVGLLRRKLSLDYSQCFGFVPLLALVGFKDVKHLNRVKIYEHILLIAQLAGNIGWYFENWAYLRGNEKLLCEKLLQTLTKYDKMKLVY